MLEIAALLLCKLGGKAGSTDEIKAVLEAAGREANEDALTKLSGDMDGKDVNELLAAGMEKLKDVPMGGGGGGGEAAAAVVEEKEEEEEAEIGGGMDMFGAGDAGGGDY